MSKLINNIKCWWTTLLKTCIREYRLVFSDVGVLLFFLALPIAYPIVYTLIYNPELVDEVPMVIVDNSRSAESRELVRMIDATQNISVIGYATDLNDAKRCMEERKAYGILEIPRGYAETIGRNQQAVLPLYCDLSLMIRYRSILFAITDVQMQLCGNIRTNTINESAAASLSSSMGESVGTESFILGDVTQGFASFVMIGIVVLILQQSIVLGVLMLGGGANERRRVNKGVDPEEYPGAVSAKILGQALCVLTIYAPLTVYILHYVPVMFNLPHVGAPVDYLLFMLPMLLASIFMAQMLKPLVVERESSFLVFVFTSVVFLFLSGLTWPRSAMGPSWLVLSSLIPASWGIEGFIAINSNNATLSDVSIPYDMLWVLTVAYFIIAVVVEKWARHRAHNRYGK